LPLSITVWSNFVVWDGGR